MIPNESIKATNISKIPIDELNSRRKKVYRKNAGGWTGLYGVFFSVLSILPYGLGVFCN